PLFGLGIDEPAPAKFLKPALQQSLRVPPLDRAARLALLLATPPVRDPPDAAALIDGAEPAQVAGAAPRLVDGAVGPRGARCEHCGAWAGAPNHAVGIVLQHHAPPRFDLVFRYASSAAIMTERRSVRSSIARIFAAFQVSSGRSTVVFTIRCPPSRGRP